MPSMQGESSATRGMGRQGRTLKEISDAQYEAWFRKAGLRKNMTNEEWMYVLHRLENRKAQGKKSLVHFRGKLLCERQIKKERSRRMLPSLFGPRRSPSPVPQSVISIRTPSPSPTEVPLSAAAPWSLHDRAISLIGHLQASPLVLTCSIDSILDFHQIPWISFLRHCERTGLGPSSDAEGILARDSQSDETGLEFDINENRIIVDHDAIRDGEIPGWLSLVVQRIGHDGSSTTFLVIAPRRTRPRLGRQVLDSICVLDGLEYFSEFMDKVRASWPAWNPGDLERKFKTMISFPSSSALFQLFEFALFLLSNNLLSWDQRDSFLQWAAQRKYHQVLAFHMKVPLPTTQAAARSLLASAFDIKNKGLLEYLLESVSDTSMLKGQNGARLLSRAVETSNLDAARTLVKSGADTHVKMWGSTSPLALAVQSGELELTRCLMDACPDISGCELWCTAPFGYPLVDAVSWVKYYGRDEMLQLLLGGEGDRGSEPAITCRGILQAAEMGTPALRQYIEKKGRIRGATQATFEIALLLAAREGSSLAVQSLLGIGVVPTAVSEAVECLHIRDIQETDSALAAAARRDDVGIVEMLLNAGANMDDWNVLLCAAGGKRETAEVLKLLLERGASAERYGGSALREAAAYRNKEAVRLLLAYGAPVNALGSGDQPRALCAAIASPFIEEAGEDVELIQMLLDAGADVNAFSGVYRARSALQCAADVGATRSAEVLLSAGADVNACADEYGGTTALQAAAAKGDVDMVDLFLNAGADVNGRAAYSYGRTALQAAAEGGHVETVRRLWNAGADVNAAPAAVVGRTALEAAVAQGHTELALTLIRLGADVNPPRGNVLGHAIWGAHWDLVRILLAEGADVNATPFCIDLWSAETTALQLAAEGAPLDIVKELLDKGADVNAPAGEGGGRTALQAAIDAPWSNMKVVDDLLAAGADVNASPAARGGVAALQAAAQQGHLPLAWRLMEAGADINTRGSGTGDKTNLYFHDRSKTPLEAAASNGRLDMVAMLLAKGAKWDSTNEKRFSVATELARREGFVAVAELLEEHERKLCSCSQLDLLESENGGADGDLADRDLSDGENSDERMSNEDLPNEDWMSLINLDPNPHL